MTGANGAARYEYCIKKAADEARLWSLSKDSGWALMTESTGTECIPIWPHSEYALQCARDAWESYEATPIDIDLWLSKWTLGMEKDGRRVAVFPTPSDVGIVVSPSRFASDLASELSKYE